MNITDIDDKTIRDSATEGVSLKEFTEKYTESFLRGLDLMNIKRAHAYPKATEYAPQMVEFVKELVDKGVAYVAKDGVYFDIDKFPDYGKLSRINISKVEKTERTAADEYEKENVNDFALWKNSTPDEYERGIYYDSPWGPGRPGWHIECSVMSRSLCGDTIDIHAGGEDLVFPHHENEIAQSESLTGKKFVRNWLHARFLMINGRKMSKSLGNYVSFDDILSRYTADAFRYFYLSVHYRRPLDYTEQAMEVAKNSVNRLENTLTLIEDALRKEDKHLSYEEKEAEFLGAVKTHRLSFEAAMDDDLDTHGAIDALHALSGSINEYVSGPANKGILLKGEVVYKELLEALGLFEKRGGGSDDLSNELIRLIAGVRERLRVEKNYPMADEIRDLMKEAGVVLSDTNEGTSWKIDRN
jgi:cysteinyl-tRNA synthetase